MGWVGPVVPGQDDPLRLRDRPPRNSRMLLREAPRNRKMLWSSSPTTVRFRWPAASILRSSNWTKFVSWNSSTRMYLYRRLELLEDGRPRPEELDDERHLVLEIDLALFLEKGLVFAEDTGDLARA